MAIALGYFLFHWLGFGTCNRRPLPPAPPSYPLIGQLLSIPRTAEGPEFANLSKELKSDVVSLNAFGTTIIVLNSADAAGTLLGKRTNIYSGRPQFAMATSPHLMDLQHLMPFMNSGPEWRKQRRMMGAQLNIHAVQKFQSSQELQGRRLLQRLLSVCNNLESSEELEPEFNWAVSEMLFDSVYGYQLKSPDDPFLTEVMTLHGNLTRSFMPSSFLVNVFPWLQHVPDWVPGTGWKQIAREWRDQKNRAMDGIYHWAKQRIVSGADDYSVISTTLQEAERMKWSQAETDTFAKNLGVAILWRAVLNLPCRLYGFAGGTGSSALSLMWFVLAMALYPEVQAKAQREIDDVVGSDRLPTFEDRSSLPYVGRVLQEVIRWQPIAPLGLPHMSTKDDEYQDCRIPKGSMMIGNIWAICHDAELYKDPDIFNPDRFLDSKIPTPPSFGWGNRACPGRHLFDSLFYIQAVLTLATFKIGKQRDEQGREVEIIRKAAIDPTRAIACPVPSKLKLSPRSAHHAELIQTAA